MGKRHCNRVLNLQFSSKILNYDILFNFLPIFIFSMILSLYDIDQLFIYITFICGCKFLYAFQDKFTLFISLDPNASTGDLANSNY